MVFSCVPGIPGAFLKSGTGARAERMHAHRERSIGFVREGSTKIRVAGQTLALRKGECVYVPPGIPHLCSPDDPDNFAYTVLYWPADADTPAAARTHSIERAPEMGDRPDDVVLAGVADASAFLSLCTARRGTTLPFDRLVSETFIDPVWSAGPFESALSSAVPCAREKKTARSRYQVYRLLRGRYGLGAHGVDQNARIERAKELLRAGRSVASTAAECGFCDQSHFVRVFRLYTGLRPIDARIV